MCLIFRVFRVYMICLFAFLLSWFCFIEGFASQATPSDALIFTEEEEDVPLEELDGDLINDLNPVYDCSVFMDVLSLYASPSDATAASLEHIEAMLKDIHTQIVPPVVEEEDFDAFGDDFLDFGVEALALSDSFSLDRNVIIYEGTWQGSAARLVLPASTAVTLFVSSDGSLYNVGTTNLIGKIFYGDFNPLSYDMYVFTLTPSLANNASAIYNNRFPSYCTHYYVSSGSLRNSVSYGLFKVDRVIHTPSDLPESVNGIYLLVLILIGGVLILCFWKKSLK